MSFFLHFVSLSLSLLFTRRRCGWRRWSRGNCVTVKVALAEPDVLCKWLSDCVKRAASRRRQHCSWREYGISEHDWHLNSYIAIYFWHRSNPTSAAAAAAASCQLSRRLTDDKCLNHSFRTITNAVCYKQRQCDSWHAGMVCFIW